jgi:hypothetical protein
MWKTSAIVWVYTLCRFSYIRSSLIYSIHTSYDTIQLKLTIEVIYHLLFSVQWFISIWFKPNQPRGCCSVMGWELLLLNSNIFIYIIYFIISTSKGTISRGYSARPHIRLCIFILSSVWRPSAHCQVQSTDWRCVFYSTLLLLLKSMQYRAVIFQWLENYWFQPCPTNKYADSRQHGLWSWGAI